MLSDLTAQRPTAICDGQHGRAGGDARNQLARQKRSAGSLQFGNYKQIGIMHRADELRFGQQSTHLEAYVVDVSRPIAKAFGFTAITTDLKESQLATLKSDGFFGFESKSQLASFFDLEAFEKFNKEKKAYYKKHKKGNFYTDFLAAEFKAYSGSNKYSLQIGDWNMHKVDNTSSVPMFSTGGQAGRFPVYWGLNKAGEIVECVIDFFVVDIK